MDKVLKKRFAQKAHFWITISVLVLHMYFFRTTLGQLWQWPTCLCPTLETIHAKYVRNHHQDSNDDYVDFDDDNDYGRNGDGNDKKKSVSTLKILAANITLREG